MARLLVTLLGLGGFALACLLIVSTSTPQARVNFQGDALPPELPISPTPYYWIDWEGTHGSFETEEEAIGSAYVHIDINGEVGDLIVVWDGVRLREMITEFWKEEEGEQS